MANKMMKKTLAILLTVVMVLGVTQMTAFAGNAEEEGEIIVVIPEIPGRPVIPSNPVRPNIPKPPVIIIEIEPEEPQIPEEPVEEPVEEPQREYERPPRPRYQPKQAEEPVSAEEASAEEPPVTPIPVEEPVAEPVAEPAEALTEAPVEEIPEEEVPLADVPVTGDGTALYTALTLFSGTGLVWLARKKDH